MEEQVTAEETGKTDSSEMNDKIVALLVEMGLDPTAKDAPEPLVFCTAIISHADAVTKLLIELIESAPFFGRSFSSDELSAFSDVFDVIFRVLKRAVMMKLVREASELQHAGLRASKAMLSDFHGGKQG